MAVLERINAPSDLAQLSYEELTTLAQEIRDLLIQVTSVNGGHLAPNLGVVELTLALHRVFHTPEDKLVWDVGHQSYIHKILTGRKDRFPTLRTYGGLSGFPKRQESPHDAFGAGHSSTSISAALGMAAARDHVGGTNHVVAIIGDGSLTGGMAMEALNNAGDQKRRLIVVLNDNEMSISHNVGALSEYLCQIRTGEIYGRIKKDAEHLIKNIPTIGEQVLETVNRVKGSVKYLFVPGMFFEDLGFTYLGPVDGHNLEKLMEVLTAAKMVTDKPVLVHVLTKKGKGYKPAEEEPNRFHGTGAFDIATGKKIVKPNTPKSYTDVFSATMLELAKIDKRIVAITAAMPEGTGLAAFARKYPKRFYDVGIAEQHAVTMAAGMAAEGLKPYVAIYSTFMQRAYDQVLHDVCMQNLPVVLCLDRAGLVGDDGYTHHGVFDYSYLRMMPGMTIMAPKDENELRHMLYTAVDFPGPISVRYPRGSGLGVPCTQELHTLPIGRAEVLREGKDLTIWAIGTMVDLASQVAVALEERGISAGVVNARFVKPLDTELLDLTAKETGFIVTMEENALAGGFGSGVLEYLSDSGSKAKVRRYGLPDSFVPHGDRKLLLRDVGLTVEAIVRGLRVEG